MFTQALCTSWEEIQWAGGWGGVNKNGYFQLADFYPQQ